MQHFNVNAYATVRMYCTFYQC